MAWNPDTYNKFKAERFAPFYDLLALVNIRPGLAVVDLGCGTGELTRRLADALPGARVLGIDTSAEMLSEARVFANEYVTFAQASLEEQAEAAATWDLVFSNAAIQWAEHHDVLLPRLIATLRPEGQLVVQLPAQPHNASNILLNELAAEEPFATALKGWKGRSSVLTTDAYARLLFENGGRGITVYEKIYPLVLPDVAALLEWVSGTALLPFVERLTGETRRQFVAEYTRRLQVAFDKTPVFYPFKRILMAATF